MAIQTISGFFASKSEPLDVKELVADSTARLALTYPYYGLKVKEQDTGLIYEYIGTPPSNVAGDWELRPTLRTGTAVPDNGDGNDGDLYFDSTTNYLYEKVAGAWTLRTDLTGAQIFQGASAPGAGLGVDGDLYFRSNGDVYQKSGGVWGAVLFNIAGTDGADGDKYAATSTTSVNIPTTHPTDVALTLDASTYAYTPGQSVVAAEDSTNFFEGVVKSYSASVLTITSAANTGTGSAPTTSWTINLDGASGQTGATGKPGTPDKVYTGASGFIFNETEISNIQSDNQWTIDYPFIGYILVDSRANKQSPAPLANDKAGYLVSWDGTTWANLGKIRGTDGNNGERGWSPVLSTATRSATEQVLQLTGWSGGSGPLPSSLTALVGRYVGSTGLVTDINLATNVRGPKGDQGDAANASQYKYFLHPATTNMNTGQAFSTFPTRYDMSFVANVSSRQFYTWTRSNSYSSEGNETVYLIARSSLFYTPSGSIGSSQALVTFTLEASLGGSFNSANQYGLLTVERTTFGVFEGTSSNCEVRSGFKFPKLGTWYFRLRVTSGVSMLFTTAVIYEVAVMHRTVT